MDTDAKSDGHNSRRKTKRVLGKGLVFIVLLAAIGLCVVLFLKYREAVDTNPNNVEQKTIETVAKLVVTPDERPTVVTVQDASKLSNPELASRAEDGDRLLVYSQNRRVIMYRPANGKIVDILSIKDETTNTSQSTGTAPIVDDAASTEP